MSKKIEKDALTSEFTLARIEGDNAVLVSAGNECLMPLVFLPKGLKEGDVIEATFSTGEAEKRKREMSAKEILNEILNV